MLLVDADWMMLTNASNQGEANSMTFAPLAHKILTANASRFESCISQKLFGGKHLDFKWIFELNASRRSINLPVYLVSDLEAGQFNHGAKYFCMERSNVCMDWSKVSSIMERTLTIVPTYNSTVIQLPSLLQNL